MIYFNFTFSRPAWANRFKNIKTWTGKTFIEHKFWEVKILKLDNLFRVGFKQNLAGEMPELRLFY
jgi:hypothetical protein